MLNILRNKANPKRVAAVARVSPSVGQKFNISRGFSHVAKDESVPHSCWKCGTPSKKVSVFCPKSTCAVIQKLYETVPSQSTSSELQSTKSKSDAAAANYFHLFSLDDQSYDVDQDKLSLAYKNLQKIVHPDKISSQISPSQVSDRVTIREISMENSMLINEAFETLACPLRRAIYMVRFYNAIAIYFPLVVVVLTA